MRTKEEIIAVLAKRNTVAMMNVSTWADLVASIGVFNTEQKDIFVKLITDGKTKKSGELLRNALYVNAAQRAKAGVEAMLADDGLDLAEIDSLL